MMAPVNHIKKSIQRWTIYLCFLWAKLCASQMLTDGMNQAEKHALSKNITAILNKLVNKEYYDKRLRPNYGGNPVDVGVTIHVSSISAVSEVEMDFTLDFYLRQMWTDPRLAFSHMGVALDALTVGVEYVNAIWVPDTFFPNEKKSFFHIATTHNSFLRISSKGEIKTSQRLTVTATCPMALQLFPLDSQECSLEIESYGFTEKDIKLFWALGIESVGVEMEKINLPTFAMGNIFINETSAPLSTGVYSRLRLTIQFTRNLGFYFTQVYLPAMLVVIISWVSFWINRDSAPARTLLGITTVLTITQLTTSTNREMPHVSYVKAMDIYLGVSYFFVFGALLEYAAVNYSGKKIRDRKKRRQRRLELDFPVLPPPDIVQSALERTETDQLLPPCTCGQHQTGPRTTDYGSITTEPLNNEVQPENVAQKHKCIDPTLIDKYCRICFPTAFLIFNTLYWVLFMKATRKNT